MNFDIESLFQEVYKIRTHNNINFISDWNVSSSDNENFTEVINNAYRRAQGNDSCYNYAYEQFSLKERIIEFLRNQNGCYIDPEELTITPSATMSINLCILALKAIGVRKILLITPAYFSTHESLNRSDLQIVYYHLLDKNNLKADLLQIEQLIREQFVEGIVLTDPVYCSGTEFNEDEYELFSKICCDNHAYFIVDYSLGGLVWNNSVNYVIDSTKINILRKCPKFLFIDTLTKRLLLNGIKFSILIGDEQIIDKIDKLAETTYGGLFVLQSELIGELYAEKNSSVINKLCSDNILKFRETHSLIKSYLLGSDYYISNTESGFFSTINHSKFRLSEIDTESYMFELLRNELTLSITKDRFTYFGDNDFGFRINLNNNKDDLIRGIGKCIQIDGSRFYKRK